MVSKEWLRDFIQTELKSIVLEMNRRNINDVAMMLAAKFEQKNLTVVPTYLSDSMYFAQQKFDSELTYKNASKMYNIAISTFENKVKTKSDDNESDGGFW